MAAKPSLCPLAHAAQLHERDEPNLNNALPVCLQMLTASSLFLCHDSPAVNSCKHAVKKGTISPP